MGWGRAFFLGDIGNQLDIQDTAHDLEQLRNWLAQSASANQSQDERINYLLSENAELKLYLASVIRLLTNKGVISQEELSTIIEAIDGEDGAVDGKLDGPIA